MLHPSCWVESFMWWSAVVIIPTCSSFWGSLPEIPLPIQWQLLQAYLCGSLGAHHMVV